MVQLDKAEVPLVFLFEIMHLGNSHIAASKFIGPTSVLLAEAVALKEGLHTALLNNFRHLLVEGDSKLLVDSLTHNCHKAAVPWRIKSVWMDIMKLASSFQTIVFRHVLREANFVADHLAARAHSVPGPAVWFNSLPLYVS